MTWSFKRLTSPYLGAEVSANGSTLITTFLTSKQHFVTSTVKPHGMNAPIARRSDTDAGVRARSQH